MADQFKGDSSIGQTSIGQTPIGNESRGGSSTGWAAVGCLTTLCSAAVTTVLLFIDGSFVLAVVSMLARNQVPYMDDERVAQFLCFTLPVAMVVVQWMMIDYVRRRLVS